MSWSKFVSNDNDSDNGKRTYHGYLTPKGGKRSLLPMPGESEEEWNSKLAKKLWVFKCSYLHAMTEKGRREQDRHYRPYTRYVDWDKDVKQDMIYKEIREGNRVKVMVYTDGGSFTADSDYVEIDKNKDAMVFYRNDFTPLSDLERDCKYAVHLLFTQKLAAKGCVEPIILDNTGTLKEVEWRKEYLEWVDKDRWPEYPRYDTSSSDWEKYIYHHYGEWTPDNDYDLAPDTLAERHYGDVPEREIKKIDDRRKSAWDKYTSSPQQEEDNKPIDVNKWQWFKGFTDDYRYHWEDRTRDKDSSSD